MKRIYFLVLVLSVFTFGFAEPRVIQGKLDETLLLSVGDTAVVSELRITLVSVNDDGCGTKRECYWSQYSDATFQIWWGQFDLGETTLSLASREDSQKSVRVGDWYVVLNNVDGYETETPTASLKVTKTL
jgi:hypothetical protein